MQLEDVEAVYALGISQEEFQSATSSFWSQEQLKRWCESSSDVTLVAEQNNQLVGFSLYAVHVPTGKATWENLYVDQKYRNSGIAAALIHEGHKCLQAIGISYVALQNHARNQEEFAAYLEKFGFTKSESVLWMDRRIDSFNLSKE